MFGFGNLNHFKKIYRNYYLWGWIGICLLGLSACGGSSSGGGSTSTGVSPGTTSGEVIIGLTDAEGDFQTYIVDVLSLKMTHLNGSEVETLPLETRVDFAEYTELTEFLTAATVPQGAYGEISLLLDYSNAEIFVEDVNGDSVQATPLDAAGDPLTLIEVSVELHGRDRFRIAPGIPAHITLDFDLESSNSLDLTTMPPEVTVNPVLVTDFVLEAPKPHRVRGVLNEVSVAEKAFSVFIRPFYRHDGDFGSIRVHVADETEYEINETTFVGEEGLIELSQIDSRSPLVAFGGLNSERQFVARLVLAGTSVPWGERDWVQGSVIARNGDLLTLSTVRRVRFDNEIDFFRTVDVQLAGTTNVSKQNYMTDPVAIDDISVGQRVRVAGNLDTTGVTPVLDASEGYARMLLTHVAGHVASAGFLSVDLQGIDGRPADLFDFTGTGSDLAFDADPDYYEINTGALALSNIAVNDPVRVTGHVTPFGSAPEDFEAHTIIDYSELSAKILVNWTPEPSTAPFISISNSELILDADDPAMGNLHKVIQAGIGTDLAAFGMDITLTANNDGTGLFTLAGPQRIRVFDNFADFSSALTELLDGTKAIQGLHANGHFDSAAVTMTLRSLVLRVRENG